MLRRYEKHVKMQNEPHVYAKALGKDSLATISLWLERTQWLITYKNVRRDVLKYITAMPTVGNSRKPWSDLNLG